MAKKKAPRFVIIRVLESTRTRLNMRAARMKKPTYKIVEELSLA